MLSNRNKRLIAITFAAAFLLMAISPAVQAVDPYTWELKIGPYVDKIVYKVISNQDQRVLAMQAGEIEMDNSFFDPVHYATLDADPNIEIFSALRNGYGHFTINCRDAPLNESVLRRAVAFALDKDAISADILDGYSQSHDSLVPYPNGWCIEDQLLPHYYAALVSTGAALLDASGKFPVGEGSVRTYKGVAISPLEVEYSSASEEIAGGSARKLVDAFLALGIPAVTKPADFNEYISRLDSHGDYDVVFYALNFYSNDVDWLAYEYWSEYADVPYQNPTNFRNDTYDSWRNQLLYGTTYEEVYEAAAWMQRILHEQCPRIVAYENTYNQAYRIDKFKDHVSDLGRYIVGPWTMRQIKNLDGSTGGTVPIAISEEPDSFNIYVTNSAYSAAVLENLWPSLYAFGPDLNPFPDLAESLLTETHADNAAVPVGHTRFTIDIIQNATWTDGVPLTADDVAFSLTYAFESYVYGNPAGTDIGDLVAAYAPTPYRAVIEFSTESYWHFSNFAYDTIIPKHIFNNVDGIGYAGWNTWNPVFDPAQPNVNCGPFKFTSFEAGEFYEVTWNPAFYFGIDHPAPTTSTTTTSDVVGPDWTLALVAGAVGAAVVILVGGFVLLRKK